MRGVADFARRIAGRHAENVQQPVPPHEPRRNGHFRARQRGSLVVHFDAGPGGDLPRVQRRLHRLRAGHFHQSNKPWRAKNSGENVGGFRSKGGSQIGLAHGPFDGGCIVKFEIAHGGGGMAGFRTSGGIFYPPFLGF